MKTTSSGGDDTIFVTGSAPDLWQNNHRNSIIVELLECCEIRAAESKTAGVIYRANGKICVRSLAEFKSKFTKIK